MIETIRDALQLLPAFMRDDRALVMLKTIGLQESKFVHRRQMGNGPAKSFWQGEIGGGMVHGVRVHKATRDHAAKLYKERGVEANDRAIWDAIEKDDILAAGLARLLLYSDPLSLPALDDVKGAWQLYLRTWRPGAYTRGDEAQRETLRKKFYIYHAQALECVRT